MAVSIEDLLQDQTKEALLADLLALASALGLSTEAWQPGEPIYDLLAIFTEQLARLWNDPIVRALRAGFLDYATDSWLTLLAWVTYGVYRREETFATMSLVVENRGGGYYSFVAGDLRVQNSNSKGFTSTSSGVLTPWSGTGAYPTVTISFQADEAGTGSDTVANDIAAYPIVPSKAPASVYVRTNAGPAFGREQETDEGLRERCRLSTGPLSASGPRSAYEAVALETLRPDGSAVNVTRVAVVEPGGGVVEVYLASDSGAASGDTVTLDSDVYLVNVRLQDLVVPPGLTVTVAAATEVPCSYNMDLTVDRKSKLTKVEATRLIVALAR